MAPWPSKWPDRFGDRHPKLGGWCCNPGRCHYRESISQLESLGGGLSEVWWYDATTVLKRVGWSPSAEAAAMRLVSERTCIPVPCVLKTIEDPGDAVGYIFMELIEGEPLGQAWETLDET